MRYRPAAAIIPSPRPPKGHPDCRCFPIQIVALHLDRSDEQGRYLYRLSHPLGEHVVQSGKASATPAASIVFDVSNHASRVHVVEALRGKAGYLSLTRLQIDSYEREEYLLFSGFDDDGGSLDQETMEKLFGCSGRVNDTAAMPDELAIGWPRDAERHAKATISLSLEHNSGHFHQAREKLEKWADDMVLSAEKALADTKEQIKALRRQARQAATLEEQHAIQEKSRSSSANNAASARRFLRSRTRSWRSGIR